MKSITLNNGILVPDIVCGTWTYDDNVSYGAVRNALEIGYRAIDTAAYYGNETGVGKAVREFGIPRKEIFVQSKIWKTEFGYSKAKKAVMDSLERLGLDYIDLMLIHWPQVKTESKDWIERNSSTWMALEELYKEKILRSIGVCNFFIEHLTRLIENATIVPMINQIELHPGFIKKDVIDFCYENNIVVQGWSPFGRGEALSNEIIVEIASKHQCEASAIILQWIRQHNAIPVVKARSIEHLKSNLKSIDFVLSDDEMDRIDCISFFGKLGYDPNCIRFDTVKKQGTLFTANKQ